MKTDSREGLGCLFLFALPFAGFGLFAGYQVTRALWEWYEMRAWVEVPAQLVSVHLETESDGDGTTYRVEASYRYSFEGSEYTGTRVALHEGSDNVGSFHQDAHRDLSRVLDAGGGYRCFVDPRSPAHSVLNRELRLGLLAFFSIFIVVFGGVGVGLIAGGVYGSRLVERENELRNQNPEKPWLHKDAWRTGKIAATKGELVTSVVFAVIWNSISAPLLFLVPRELSRGNIAASLGLLFPAVGLGLLIWAAKNVIRVFKYGESVLELKNVPGVIGGRLEGVVRAPKGLHRATEIEVRLSAVGRARIESGDGSRTEETFLWQRTNVEMPQRNFGRGSVQIPVRFDIPADLPPTDETDSSYQIVWRLDVKAELPGVDYHARFDVPVFKTEKTAASVPAFRAALPAHELHQRLKKAGIRVESLGAGKSFVFERSRDLRSSLSVTVVFVVVAAVGVVLFLSDAPRLFPWVASGFAVLFLFAALDQWLDTSRLDVVPGALSVRSGWLGGGKEKRYSSTEILEVRPTRGPQAGDRLTYRLEVLRRSGRPKKIARRIPDLETAESLAREVDSVLRS